MPVKLGNFFLVTFGLIWVSFAGICLANVGPKTAVAACAAAGGYLLFIAYCDNEGE